MTMARRVQVILAHPDDESFGCGSLLLWAKAAGATTAVCCATRGEAGGSEADLGTIRERELYAAADLLGVDQVNLLEFADSAMNGPAGPGTLVGSPLSRVVAAVREQITAFRPDVVVTLDAADGHRDHARIRDAALAAAGEVGVPRSYLYCLPRSLMRRWVEQMQQQRPGIEHLDADTAALGTPDELITTVLDVRGHLTQRERAIAAHASQTSPYEGLPQDLREAFLTVDHLRRVEPAWPGGEPENTLLP
jgi:LmbE family N-acetylglucosaminyl deacetylase